MAVTLDQLIIEITARDEKITAALKDVNQQIQQFEQKTNKSLQNVQGSFDNLGRVQQSIDRVHLALAAVSASVVLLGKSTLSTAANFEAAMNRVQAVSGATGQEF